MTRIPQEPPDLDEDSPGGSDASPRLKPLPREILQEAETGNPPAPATADAEGLAGAESQSVVPETRPKEDNLGDSLDAAWKIHTYVNEYVRFADAKAGFVVGIVSATLAALFASDLHTEVTSTPMSEFTLAAWASFASFAFLGLSVATAVAAILPRLGRVSTTSIVSWPNIAGFETADEFEAEARSVSQQNRLSAILRHIHLLAVLCKRKYRWVNLSIIFGLIGAALGALLLLSS